MPTSETRTAELDHRRRREAIVVAAIVGAFAAYWATCSVLIHRSFHSNGWDLGLTDQVLWNSAHGRLFEYSFRDMSYAGDHWSPFLLLLVPLKWAVTGPEALLVLQAAVLAVAALPLYSSVRSMTGRGAATAVAGAYLLGLGPARAISFDFHLESFAPLLAFTTLWGLTRRQPWIFVAAALLILALKEDGALLTLALCWIAWFAFGQRATVGAVAAAAVVYGFVAMELIIPHFRGSGLNPFAERYGYLGDSAPRVLIGLVVHSDLVARQLARREAVSAAAIVLASAAFLPLRVPRLLPPLVMITLLPLLSREPAQGSLDLHYLLVPSTVALLIATVAVRDRTAGQRGSAIGASRMTGRLMDRVWPFGILAFPAVLLVAVSPLPPSFAADDQRFDVGHHAAVGRSFVGAVPPNAIVSAQSLFVPHLSERTKLYEFPRVLDAEFVIVDSLGPIPASDLAAGYEACLAALPRLGFDNVRSEDGMSLWRKVRPAEPTPDVPAACSGQHPAAGP